MGDDEEYSGPATEIVTKLDKMTQDGDFTNKDLPRLCEQALVLDPKCFPAHVYLGYYEIDRKNHVKMFDHFLKALELSDRPYNVYTWDWVVMALDDGLKDYERLAVYLRRFYEKYPKLIQLRYLVRILGGKLGRKNEALAAVDDYLLKNPNDKKALKLRKKVEKGKWLWI